MQVSSLRLSKLNVNRMEVSGLATVIRPGTSIKTECIRYDKAAKMPKVILDSKSRNIVPNHELQLFHFVLFGQISARMLCSGLVLHCIKNSKIDLEKSNKDDLETKD